MPYIHIFIAHLYPRLEAIVFEVLSDTKHE